MDRYLFNYPLTHGGLRKIIHPRLNVEVDNQTAVKYMRFIRPVKIDTLELPRYVYGRWVPSVPTHPAHLLISVPDLQTGRWRLVREVDLPYDPRLAGEGLAQGLPIETLEDYFAELMRLPPYQIDLDGLETDLLRVECDREHPVWPNHGECNGGPFNVPFGILDPLRAVGRGDTLHRIGTSASLGFHFRYLPGLQVIENRPSPPAGMSVRQTPIGVFFESPAFSIGFSLRRPFLLHLGWDALALGQGLDNRLKDDLAWGSVGQLCGLSGPLLKTFTQEFGAQHWTGEAAVRGNVVEYTNLHSEDGLMINATFTVEPQGCHLELTQTCTQAIPVLEAETWRLAWDLRKGSTATAAVPTRTPGRNGQVTLPLAWAADGTGCLECQETQASPDAWVGQVESYRTAGAGSCGFTPGGGPGNEDLFTVPQGKKHLALQLHVSLFKPNATGSQQTPGVGVRRHWGSIYACFRPEQRGFSNNAASTNCHLSQIAPMDIAFLTRKLDCGLDPIKLGQFTLQQALLDGGGYGYWRNLYLDSDPALLIAAGRLHQAQPDFSWLRQVEAGLREVALRMLANQDENGLLVCRDLSGNSGTYRWSCNTMDIIGFGHLDGYVNAIGYRALRNASALFRDLGKTSLSDRCQQAALEIKAAYAETFINPKTGWLAGWRSRDGMLHDYGFTFVNGPAIAFGLLEPAQARQALLNLEAAHAEIGLPDGTLGVPGNLLPIPAEDHLLPGIVPTPTATFESYSDGGLYGFFSMYYLRALSLYGLKEQAARLAAELDNGLACGYFNGGLGSGSELRTWEGLTSGYEGTLIGNFGPVYSLAIEQGVIQPPDPEWWPA